MLGLVISDSFKAVVTIYILIPFLVIPQIILSGVMVKFEKLNPSIPLTNPVGIPFYGEFITARWGYEALAVNQFIYNKFEIQFYEYEKMKSRGNYKRNFWCNDLNLKLNAIGNGLRNGEIADDFMNDLQIVSNEIKKELDFNPKIKFDYTQLAPEKITNEAVLAAQGYIETIRKYYIEYYNLADRKKNALVEKLQKQDGNLYLELRDKYHNKSLQEFVTNDNEQTKNIEYNGEFVQKMDPIYLDPQYKFLKAHFYAPSKQLFGIYIDTYIANVIVLWIMTAGLYLVLYFRLLKRLLDSGEELMGRKLKEKEQIL